MAHGAVQTASGSQLLLLYLGTWHGWHGVTIMGPHGGDFHGFLGARSGFCTLAREGCLAPLAGEPGGLEESGGCAWRKSTLDAKVMTQVADSFDVVLSCTGLAPLTASGSCQIRICWALYRLLHSAETHLPAHRLWPASFSSLSLSLATAPALPDCCPCPLCDTFSLPSGHWK